MSDFALLVPPGMECITVKERVPYGSLRMERGAYASSWKEHVVTEGACHLDLARAITIFCVWLHCCTRPRPLVPLLYGEG